MNEWMQMLVYCVWIVRNTQSKREKSIHKERGRKGIKVVCVSYEAKPLSQCTGTPNLLLWG